MVLPLIMEVSLRATTNTGLSRMEQARNPQGACSLYVPPAGSLVGAPVAPEPVASGSVPT